MVLSSQYPISTVGVYYLSSRANQVVHRWLVRFLPRLRLVIVEILVELLQVDGLLVLVYLYLLEQVSPVLVIGVVHYLIMMGIFAGKDVGMLLEDRVDDPNRGLL